MEVLTNSGKNQWLERSASTYHTEAEVSLPETGNKGHVNKRLGEAERKGWEVVGNCESWLFMNENSIHLIESTSTRGWVPFRSCCFMEPQPAAHTQILISQRHSKKNWIKWNGKQKLAKYFKLLFINVQWEQPDSKQSKRSVTNKRYLIIHGVPQTG